MNDFDEWGYDQHKKKEPVFWMQTNSLKQVDPLNFKPEDVDINDIAHHTSKIDRFTGAGNMLYPVALHSLIGSYLVPQGLELTFLMHDAAEAYIGDISTPLKNSIKDDMIRKMEDPILRTIFEKFNIPYPMSQIVKDYDLAMCFYEGDKLGLDTSVWWTVEPRGLHIADLADATGLFEEIHWSSVKALFLQRFEYLTQAVDPYLQTR